MPAQVDEITRAEAGTSPQIKYRPDVDGLRAIAVLLVLADHLDTKMSGGYIGVDVFFVISGYLISATILAEMAKGKFSIAAFYERRIRRIFPALLAMLLVTTVLAYRYFVPTEVEAYAKSLLAALASGSNFYFWHNGGYFDQPAAEPLLHTWSLGVEEQFYILFPVFLVLVRRWFPQRMKAAVLGIAAVSFIAACLAMPMHPIAAFFFAPLRAWELLIGTVVSQRYLPSLKSAVSRNIASAAGLLLILVPGAMYTSGTGGTVFPGWTAFPPCLGAALIIAAGETGPSVVGRALAWRPVAFIGLISYSLYLWHWPLIVFQDAGGMIVHSVVLNRTGKAVIALASIVIAALSWRFVEQPFRKGSFRPGRRSLFAISGFATILLAVLAGGMLVAHGMPWRFPPDAQKVAAYTAYNAGPTFRTGTCFITPDNTFADFRKDKCLGVSAGKPSILIAGDSHSAMLWYGLHAVFSDRDVMEASASDCAPLLQDARRESPNCKKLLGFLFNDYLPHHRVDVLLLEARWRPMDFPGLDATVDYARSHGIPVVLVGPSMEYDKFEPRIIAFGMREGQVGDLEEHMRPGPRSLDDEMAELARTRWHVPYISFFDDLCKPACPIYANPLVPLMFDGGHMTADGSVLFAKAIRADGQLP